MTTYIFFSLDTPFEIMTRILSFAIYRKDYQLNDIYLIIMEAGMTTYEKSRDFIIKKRETYFPELLPDTLLCHYTDVEGLKGILELNSFWLTDKCFMNDKLEETYSKKLVVSCFNKINNSAKIDDYLHGLFNEKKDYILSFSTVIDSHSHWANYGGLDGYCIVYKLSDILNPFINNNFDMSYGLVIYEKDDQLALIQDYLKIIEKGKENMDNPEYNNFGRFEVSLRMLLSRFKQKNHESEKEYRIIIHSTDQKIRIRKGIFTPFIPVDISTAMPVKIIVGPKLEPKLAKEGLEQYLESTNKSITVENSLLVLR